MTESIDEFPSATRQTTREEEEAALEQLGRYFQIVDRWVAEDEQGGGLLVQPRSALAGDDAATNPYQLSHAAIHGIAGALDHLHSLRILIQTAESLTTFSPFTLNRAAIEGAAMATWVLAPRSRDERIRRRLVLANQNARDLDGVITTMGKPSSLADRQDKIREIARRRRTLDPNAIVGGRPGMERIVREAGDAFEIGSDLAVACWKACSGITHSRQWATMILLDREELSRVANVPTLRVTASFKNVLSVTAISVSLSAEARRLFSVRATAHV